jgi:hypothetical protein
MFIACCPRLLHVGFLVLESSITPPSRSSVERSLNTDANVS